ncbi:hypothetical protein [Neobacillus niacini]|uniref:hypothetical protein n=1 Tax=Neobacillus niacini TaxID=86668 RepID=UPI002863F330|nr:hypothetical protein [Neobacillus niacini]MDR7000028.1 ABC-type dipeptide/oligopeptide/nickel transport system permease component [Neobacillus niacini]
MDINSREFWMIVHLVLGAVFIHSFVGGINGLISKKEKKTWFNFLSGTWLMAITSWLTCIIGTFVVYIWYRAQPPEGVSNLEAYPRTYLLETKGLEYWHEFGMEWKEHIGWLSPILATAVAFIVIKYGSRLIQERKLKKILSVIYIIAFSTALIAGALGALINKVAPNTFLDL